MATGAGADLTPPSTGGDLANGGDDAGTPKKHVILFVWDGLRPDSITAADTPNLHALQAAGVNFTDNHATYPTFTMMNAGSLATGSFPGSTGFYGNTLYAPGATGNGASGAAADFVDPVFTEDSQILQDLDAFYSNKLLLVGSLFQAAQAAGLSTCAVGKRGPAFLQDYKKGGLILDEDFAWPLSFAKELQSAGFALPLNTTHAYGAGAITLAGSNGSPTAAMPAVVRLTDGQTSDPTVGTTSRYNAANAYLMNTFLFYVLPQKDPSLSVIWLRNPDTTEHDYGPGSPAYKDALHTQDMLLGQLLQQLRNLHIDTTTDVVVMSDHAHSTVSGPVALFPLRDIAAGAVNNSAVDAANGWSVSGEVRLADLLARAGFTAYDGFNCSDAPVMNGIKDSGGAGTPVYQEFANTVPPAFGAACAAGAPAKYTTGNFVVPATLPAKALVIAANGGSDYIYVPDH
ncbi:MAG: alkaline phosphatase family protein, partial [Myxococcales bacterium]|nr:alkaline phosphatase family protein [Myxococcales bacterium]